MERVIGPLGYLFTALLFAAPAYAIADVLTLSQWPRRRFTRALTTIVLGVESTWLTSLARQIVFELRSGDPLSSHIDTCSAAFMPISIAILAILTVAAAAVFSALGTLGPRVSAAAAVTGRWMSRGQLAALTLAIVSGAFFGVWTWGDWRIDRPCL